MTPAPHGAAPATTDQTVPSGAVTRVSSANGGASAPAPTRTVRGPQNGASDLTARLATIRATLDNATPGPWEAIGSCIEPVAGGEDVVSTDVDCMNYCYGGIGRGIESKANREFIASAPVTVARLLAAVEAVMELAENWRYKGEFGWGAWQEGHGPDETGQALDHASSELRIALTNALEEKP